MFVNGELWRARTEDGEPLHQGDEVEVERMDGLELSCVRAARRIQAPGERIDGLPDPDRAPPFSC